MVLWTNANTFVCTLRDYVKTKQKIKHLFCCFLCVNVTDVNIRQDANKNTTHWVQQLLPMLLPYLMSMNACANIQQEQMFIKCHLFSFPMITKGVSTFCSKDSYWLIILLSLCTWRLHGSILTRTAWCDHLCYYDTYENACPQKPFDQKVYTCTSIWFSQTKEETTQLLQKTIIFGDIACS